MRWLRTSSKLWDNRHRRAPFRLIPQSRAATVQESPEIGRAQFACAQCWRDRNVDRGKALLRWGIEQCPEYIEFRELWEGHVDCIDVVQQFSLSVNQASSDPNRYIALVPGNMVHDNSARTYVRGPDFDCKFRTPDAAHYLTQLRLATEDVRERKDSWTLDLPPYASAPTPERGVNPVTLRAVVGAISRSEAIDVKFRPLSSPEPRWRWITPHAIVFDGFRWHTRAFCLTAESFKGFLLSRIIELRGACRSENSAHYGRHVHSEVTLEVGPHPDLSETQAKVIALDSDMRGAKAKIKVRRAILCYALRRFEHDTNPSARRPQDQQIVLMNEAAAIHYDASGARSPF